jgi:protein gp37
MAFGRRLAAGSTSDAAGGDRSRPARDEWYNASWNPTAGCSIYSPGCENCWAMRVAAQLARMGGAAAARYAGLTRMERVGPVWTGEIRVRGDLLTWPLFRRQPRRIAVDSMSDLFHETLATATIDLLHAVMAVAHWHTFLVLTKRARRMREYYSDPETPRRIAGEIATLSSVILPIEDSRRNSALGVDPRGSGDGASSRSTRALKRSTTAPQRSAGSARTGGTPRHWVPGFSRVKYDGPGEGATEIRPVGLEPWPLPNLWPGVSVEDQNRITRVGDLLQTPAAMRWVCFEPLIARIRPDAVPIGDGFFDSLAGRHYAIDGRGRAVALDEPAWRPLDWVVAGGEIGAGARPTHPDWVRELRDQCVAAGVPFFFRQWGEWAPAPPQRPDQIVVRIGKRASGRLLDGHTWDEMPAVLRAG